MKIYKILILVIFFDTVYSESQWILQNTGTNQELMDAHFKSENTGWVCGYKGIILRTTDGGTQWHQYRYDSNYTMNSICFINENTGFVSGTYYESYQFQFSRVLKTTDAGLTWNLLTSVTGYYDGMQITSVNFYNANTGIITVQGSNGFASRGRLLLTTNSGANWNLNQNFPEYMSFSKVLFTESGTAYLFSRFGNDVGHDTQYVYKSTNYGQVWTKIFQRSHSGIRNIFYTNGILSLTGIKPQSTEGVLIQSYNEGINWNTIINGTLPAVLSAYFINQNIGWYGTSGNIYYTENGGINWYEQQQSGQFSVNYIQIFNNCTGWGIGSYGKIWKTTSCGITGINQTSFEIPQMYSLSQNYPNPFNPQTNIKFQISKSGIVKLIIFDVLGEEIQALVNQELSPGTYSADFDGSNLPSGVYYYKFEANSFTETKKMVLLK